MAAAAGALRVRLLQLMRLQERQFYLEKLEAIERLCMLAGLSSRPPCLASSFRGFVTYLAPGNTSVNRGGGVRLAVADAVLDVCLLQLF